MRGLPAFEKLEDSGGHGDIHTLPLDSVQDIGHRLGFSILRDGVPEVLKAVRTNLRRNARLIKVCASGGVMSDFDDPLHQQFSDEELSAIVGEARRAERIVAAHCHGKAGIMAAVRAGCHTIEHGSFIDEEAADFMADTHTMMVPTRFGPQAVLESPNPVSELRRKKGEAAFDAHQQSIELALDRGIKIATGCDIFVSGEMYGQNSREIGHLIDAGMSDLGAIEAATANGPDTLGPQAPTSGQLVAGFDADLITLDTNPLDDRNVWGDRDRVTGVWKAGVRVKGPRASAAKNA